jgi:hypothetical protein
VASSDHGILYGLSNQKEVGMLSPSELRSLRSSIGRLIKITSTIALLTMSSATVAMAHAGRIPGFVQDHSIC